MTKDRHLLIDGDVLVFQVTAAIEEAICWDEETELWTLHADFGRAKALFEQRVAELVEATEAHSCSLAYSHHENFRKQVLPEYKSNRKGKRKPTVYPRLVEWSAAFFDVHVLPRMEADDVLGVMATMLLKETVVDPVIATIDKDLRQIPGFYFNIDSGQLEWITPEEGRRFHLFQTLVGDQTDGYSGCPGVGKVTAERALKEGTWDEVVATYKKAKLNEDYALQQARVAKILEEDLWDGKEIKLWSPRSP